MKYPILNTIPPSLRPALMEEVKQLIKLEQQILKNERKLKTLKSGDIDGKAK